MEKAKKSKGGLRKLQRAITGDDQLRREGKLDQATGKVEQE